MLMTELNADTQPESKELSGHELLEAMISNFELLTAKRDGYQIEPVEVDYELTESEWRARRVSQKELLFARRSAANAAEVKLKAIIDHILTMDISYDDARVYLQRVGIGADLKSEEDYLEGLGYGPGAVVGFGIRALHSQTVLEVGMTLNRKLGAEVKPYVWFSTLENGSYIVGAHLAKNGLAGNIGVVSGYREIALTKDARDLSG